MEGEHAYRFHQELNNLSGREFVSAYLKSLEFFKPKITRQEGGRDEVKSPTINIQINR